MPISNDFPKIFHAYKSLRLTLGLTLASLLFILGLFDFVLRLPTVQSTLVAPRLGSRHSQLGAKYAYLSTLLWKTGHIDCIAIGSSTMDQALNPIVFAAAYEVETGKSIRCFNFAIDAIVPSANRYIAEILVEDFSPDLLVVGTDARDFTVAENDRDITVITDTPWVRYRSGKFDILGWLTENVYTYRYAWHLQRMIHGQFDELMRPQVAPSISLGQTPEETSAPRVTSFDFPHKDEGLIAYYHERLGNYHVRPENTAGLEEILSMSNGQTQVILVEMPVPAGFFHFFSNPEADYAAFVEHAQILADQNQVLFVRTTGLELIPDNGWFDFSHVNVIGADAFSKWLGHEIVTMWHRP